MSAEEREAVRTTIVGGRPPGAGRNHLAVPRGIEVLVKKASVDPVFRELLLQQRAAAAKDIGLDLDPAEAAMLGNVPRPQLVQIIEQTTVPDEQRRAFLGKVAMVMLAALGVGAAGCEPAKSRGIQPDKPASVPTKSTSSDLSLPTDKVKSNDSGVVTTDIPPDLPVPNPPTAGNTSDGPRLISPPRVMTYGNQPDRP